VEIAEHIDALDAEIEPFVAAVEAAGLDAAVPTCPGWVVRDLVQHMGGVHRWAALHVREARKDLVDEDLVDVVGGWPPDAATVAWFREGHRLLVDDLRAAPADLECFTFLRSESPLAMWARRQAHETIIHRVDAEAAAGTLTTPASDIASDGIDELLTCFITRRSSKFRLDPARTIEISAADTGGVWSVLVGPDRITTSRAAAESPDVAIRGAAADLYLFLWNRGGQAGLEAEGDTSLAAAWANEVKVSWS
jgi:uncharacterized protein (TIGR03083 family)